MGRTASTSVRGKWWMTREQASNITTEVSNGLVPYVA
jgi:hypothetical protein